MVFGFAGQNVKDPFAKMVLIVVCMLHHSGFKDPGGLFLGREVLPASFLGGPFRLPHIFGGTLNSM